MTKEEVKSEKWKDKTNALLDGKIMPPYEPPGENFST